MNNDSDKLIHNPITTRNDEFILVEAISDEILNTEIKYRCLFEGQDWDLYDKVGNLEEQSIQLLHKRISALREIYQRGCFDGLNKFWRTVAYSWKVGDVCGSEDSLSLDKEFLPMLLESKDESDRKFVEAYISRRYQTKHWDWVNRIDRSLWTVSSKAQFFSMLPFMKSVWEYVNNELGAEQSAYWKITSAIPESDHFDGIELAVEQLIQNDRSNAAINYLSSTKFWCDNYVELALKALALCTDTHDGIYSIDYIFEHLQKDQFVDEEQLASLEIKFLSRFDRSDAIQPTTLYHHLAERPEFFCDVIHVAYGSFKPFYRLDCVSHLNACDLLERWNYPPGLKRDNSYDAQALKDWIIVVKKSFLERDYWKSASLHIGKVLFYTPRDENGLWLDPVCELLNSPTDPNYRIGLFNKFREYYCRNPFEFPDPTEEIVFAEKLEKSAATVENKEFYRLGKTLRVLGQAYREDARLIEQWIEITFEETEEMDCNNENFVDILLMKNKITYTEDE